MIFTRLIGIATITFFVSHASAQTLPEEPQLPEEPPVEEPIHGLNCTETTTANGKIVVGDGGERARFNVKVTHKKDQASGKLDYSDKANGVVIKSSELLNYEVVDTQSRRFTFVLPGSDETNVFTAVVLVQDLGKKGKNDFFSIEAGDYAAAGNLRNGQIKLKGKKGGCNNALLQ